MDLYETVLCRFIQQGHLRVLEVFKMQPSTTMCIKIITRITHIASQRTLYCHIAYVQQIRLFENALHRDCKCV